jgi:hypothetical protein
VDYRRARKPVGGFLFLTVLQLSMVWWAYRKRHIQLKDLRVWFGALELVARRCGLKDEQTAHYGIEELRRLVAGRGGEKDSLRRLEQVGLLTWSTSAITFATEPSDLRINDLEGLEAMCARIQNNRRKIPVPRQIVRFIAAPSKRCVIATILGHLMRCLYYRAGECVSGGFCKAAWIAEVFAVDLRNVKGARRFLRDDLGWLEVVRVPQSLLNRYGQRVVINLSWDGSAVEKSTDEHRELPPPRGLFTVGLPPLTEHKKPLQDSTHQKPVGGGTTEVYQANQEQTPTLKHIIPPDLSDTGRLLTLFDEAQASGLIGGSEHERLTFVALAERARLVGNKNPPGLFAKLLRQKLYHFITEADEDRAHKRLKEHLYGALPGEILGPVETPRAGGTPALSQDAFFVQHFLSQLARTDFSGDAFLLIKRDLPDWTRERWEQARVELEASKMGSATQVMLAGRRCFVTL